MTFDDSDRSATVGIVYKHNVDEEQFWDNLVSLEFLVNLVSVTESGENRIPVELSTELILSRRRRFPPNCRRYHRTKSFRPGMYIGIDICYAV